MGRKLCINKVENTEYKVQSWYNHLKASIHRQKLAKKPDKLIIISMRI